MMSGEIVVAIKRWTEKGRKTFLEGEDSGETLLVF